jgi:hypothetical protein
MEVSQEREVTASELTLNQQVNQLNQEQSMPLNSYVTLGRSGLRVSPFCLGVMVLVNHFSLTANALAVSQWTGILAVQAHDTAA